MDEGKARIKADREGKAKALMENPLIVEFFEAMDKQIYEGFRLSEPTETASRERAYMMSQVLADFKNYLELVARNGDKALKEMKKQDEGKPTNV